MPIDPVADSSPHPTASTPQQKWPVKVSYAPYQWWDPGGGVGVFPQVSAEVSKATSDMIVGGAYDLLVRTPPWLAPGSGPPNHATAQPSNESIIQSLNAVPKSCSPTRFDLHISCPYASMARTR